MSGPHDIDAIREQERQKAAESRRQERHAPFVEMADSLSDYGAFFDVVQTYAEDRSVVEYPRVVIHTSDFDSRGVETVEIEEVPDRYLDGFLEFAVYARAECDGAESERLFAVVDDVETVVLLVAALITSGED